MPIPASRNEAIRVGARHFYTGIPCKRGHLSERTTINGRCVLCNREDTAYQRQRAKEAIQNGGER